ncbi:hypothetical protein [Caballeronia sp. INSB1]|uniref:hypothetical protein n=1 Tax=Caballeronia sp. INSB1 TaxID=2921751 RepID=UPI002032BF78|nr:hypothetical protein [Caballeronia sp. INSB1]
MYSFLIRRMRPSGPCGGCSNVETALMRDEIMNDPGQLGFWRNAIATLIADEEEDLVGTVEGHLMDMQDEVVDELKMPEVIRDFCREYLLKVNWTEIAEHLISIQPDRRANGTGQGSVK